ncbi:hypothetical protein EDB82DRAFT_493134 [Fusarium venenatum]|uniref:uncharacterized protein n=1 Tax=Fusarium venenatum TaxID=56646 RepID=UPI001DF83D0E|nr:hypothetical protein EDB82DRAFT_493134 [Fusarium venenatum]
MLPQQNVTMAPTPTPAPVSSSPKESDTLYWVSTGLGLLLAVTLVIILGMSLRIRDYIVEKQEQDKRLMKFQDALRDSESDRKGLQREADLLSGELANWRTLHAECWDEMTVTAAYCREHHSRNLSDQSDKRSDFSFQAEGPDDGGPESRAGWVRMGQVKRGKPSLTPFSNGDAAHYVVNGRRQVPQQIQFGSMSTIDLDPDDEQVDNLF